MARHLQRKEAVALGTVHTEAFQLAPVIDEAQAVAIGKARHRCHIETVATQLLHLSHILADGLRCVEGGDVHLSATQEIMGKTTVESLLQVGLEGIAGSAQRRTLILARALPADVVEALAVGRHHILHVVDILQPAFDLERAGSGISQGLQVVYLAHILEGQQMTLMLYLLSVGIEKVELHAAELGTLAPVG